MHYTSHKNKLKKRRANSYCQTTCINCYVQSVVGLSIERNILHNFNITKFIMVKRSKCDDDDISATTKKQKNPIGIIKLQHRTKADLLFLKQVKKRRQGKDKKGNNTMRTPSLPRTIQIERSNEESSSYGNRSNSTSSDSTRSYSTTSSKSHNDTLSTFTPSSRRIVQYELAIKTWRKCTRPVSRNLSKSYKEN